MTKRGTKRVLEYARLAMGLANVRASRYGIRSCSSGYSSTNIYPVLVQALERNPENFKVYSNRAGALAKLMQFGPALEDIEKGIKLDPTFVKFYTRRGNIEFYQKEYHKCIDTFQAVRTSCAHHAHLMRTSRAMCTHCAPHVHLASPL